MIISQVKPFTIITPVHVFSFIVLIIKSCIKSLCQILSDADFCRCLNQPEIKFEDVPASVKKNVSSSVASLWKSQFQPPDNLKYLSVQQHTDRLLYVCETDRYVLILTLRKPPLQYGLPRANEITSSCPNSKLSPCHCALDLK